MRKGNVESESYIKTGELKFESDSTVCNKTLTVKETRVLKTIE